ncbi:ArsR/SmtB family transcription factor [Stackebrandtia soli]|uniref:ArsR/SmtB family transcription factor n=1 Tax=Stackebrandtia soli TaxID=1892856 RepID=UPI0039E73CAF
MSDEPIPFTSEAIKALASPLRRRILRQLGNHGPATSTTIATALGHNSGTTSYHLRLLAKAGFIEELPERAKGRERWWRLIPADRRMPDPADLSDADRSAASELLRARLTEDLTMMASFLNAGNELHDWAEGSRGRSHLTKEELRAFHDDYVALLRRYSKPPEDASPGARPIMLRWYGFPDPDA